MDKQKKIEESKSCYSCNHYYACEDCYKAFTRSKDYFKKHIAHNREIAMLCKCYQPKIPEGAVVLTREEYKRYERIEKIIKLAKREKANGYEVKNGKLYYFSNMLDGFEYEFKDLQEICDTANHYNEEFWGLDQRLAFWQGKAEETRKETAEKFAEMLKYEVKFIPNHYFNIYEVTERINKVCKEITESK